MKTREEDSSRNEAASHSKKAGTRVEISGIILSCWNPTETPVTNKARSPSVTASISSRELTAPVAFPVGSEENALEAQSGHQEWGKRIHSIRTLFYSLHPALRREPFAKLEHAQALPLNALVRKVPCPIPEAVPEMCRAVQLLVGRCFQRNRVHIVPQVTHAEIIPLRKRQKEQSHLFLQGGFAAWRSKAGAASGDVRCFPLPCSLDPCFVHGRGRQAMGNTPVCQPTPWHPSQWQPLATGSMGGASPAHGPDMLECLRSSPQALL